MKFDLMDELLMLIPEDEADVFSLAKVVTHFSHETFWETIEGISKLKSITINIKDVYTILCMLLKENEHHFVDRR